MVGRGGKVAAGSGCLLQCDSLTFSLSLSCQGEIRAMNYVPFQFGGNISAGCSHHLSATTPLIDLMLAGRGGSLASYCLYSLGRKRKERSTYVKSIGGGKKLHHITPKTRHCDRSSLFITQQRPDTFCPVILTRRGRVKMANSNDSGAVLDGRTEATNPFHEIDL